MQVTIKQGDITNEEVGAIVNAANPSLMGGGGVDGAIHRKGGDEIREACKVLRKFIYPDGLPVGEAAATIAGKLPSRHVIHTVGPVFDGEDNRERDTLLKNAYKNSLKLADRLGDETVAFPAISAGVYGYPLTTSILLGLEAVQEHQPSHPNFPLREVRFILFDADQYATAKRVHETFSK